MCIRDSNGGVSGAETITADNAKGMAYHIGGWKNIPGTAFVYNNKRISFDFDTDAIVDAKSSPHVHMTFDVLGLFNGHHMWWPLNKPNTSKVMCT